ncbi:deoxyribodipyrimidine photo-lyase [Corynebacterium tapiri]
MWFRDDLRLSHIPALAAAAAAGEVKAVYVYETNTRRLGGAARWWLHHSLRSLIDALAQHDVPLTIARGEARDIIPRFALPVYCSTRYHQPLRAIDDEIAEMVDVQAYEGFLLSEPGEILTGQGKPYKVFTPFSRKLRDSLPPKFGAIELGELRGPGADVERSVQQLEALQLLDSATAPAQHWQPGEAAALEQLELFADSLAGYAKDRDIPSLPVTSRLSPRLRFGELSPQQVWDRIPAINDDARAFLSQLMWRDFAWHRLWEHPDLATTNVRREFDRFPWSWGNGEDDDVHTWQQGKTGIELVDAGMRELLATGYMHNRVRMVVGSFLTKNLGIHWRHGEEWFWEMLVDADLACNAFNWQWVAGCGDDASPYFRIFNPATQAKRFDPQRRYISRWIKEIDSEDYPDPMVDLRESRQAALDAYALTK